jgi:putative DNA primase/helicase
VTAAETIARALGKAQLSGDWWRCRCPVHQSAGPTLALRDGTLGLIVHCHAGCRRDWIREELVRLGLLDPAQERVDVHPRDLERQRIQEERRRQQRIAAALDFWGHETVDPHGTVIERYWRSRGLSLPLPLTIRASRSWIRHPDGGSRPAMVALVEHVDYGPVAIHRTWLAIDGSQKASFHKPKMSLGPVGGAAVRLADASERLVIAEGIETAASVMFATGFPAWAAISAPGLENLILPPLPIAHQIIIAGDHDDNGVGERAAWIAAERWLAEGRRVRIALPPKPDTDWNDVLLSNDGEARHAA